MKYNFYLHILKLLKYFFWISFIFVCNTCTSSQFISRSKYSPICLEEVPNISKWSHLYRVDQQFVSRSIQKCSPRRLYCLLLLLFLCIFVFARISPRGDILVWQTRRVLRPFAFFALVCGKGCEEVEEGSGVGEFIVSLLIQQAEGRLSRASRQTHRGIMGC